jgi:predicted enzyme related to lactoylglutathione lyase
MHGDLVYFVIAARDAERARTFYGGLFGWDFEPGNVADGWQIGRSNLPGGLQGGADPSPPQVYFEVDDLEEALVRIRAMGGETDGPKGSGAGSYANCRDDQGSEFSIFQAAE